MNVRLTGLSTENENPAVIAPYNKGGDTWSALVAPQKVAQGTAFITCTFTSGKSFVYRMQKEAEWKVGEEYTYTVSLAAAEDPEYSSDYGASHQGFEDGDEVIW
jgi:putative lipoprotein